jgi:hypothetical protein
MLMLQGLLVRQPETAPITAIEISMKKINTELI